MLKSLAIFAVVGAFLCVWPSMAENYQSDSHTAKPKPDEQKHIIPPTHVVTDPPLPASNPGQPEPDQSQPNTPEQNLPRFERPEWVIVYITIAYAFIAWLTLLAIKRQANTMETQAKEDRKSATAAAITTADTLAAIRRQADSMEKQAIHMESQLQEMHKAREIEDKTLILQYRPKVVVRRTTADEFNRTELDKPATAMVYFTVVNIGGSPAYIKNGEVLLIATIASDRSHHTKDGNRFVVEEFTLQPGQERTFSQSLTAGFKNDLGWENFFCGVRTDPRLRMLHLSIDLTYWDNLDIPRRSHLVRAYEPKRGRFLRGTEPDEEYAD
jgi:hypothetical protein